MRRHLGRLRRCAARHGLRLELPAGAGELERRARRAADEGVERLLVAGGDGTVHWAVQGLAESATALAVIPLGSGNDFASSLGAPSGIDEAMAMALDARPREIDLIHVTAGDIGRWVAGVAYVGIDSEVNRAANGMRSPAFGWIVRGPLLYMLALLEVLPGFRPVRARVEVESAAAAYEGRVMFVAAANAPRYGGGMRIAPAARLDDGLLEIVVVTEISKLALLRVFPSVFSGAHVRHPAVRTLRSRWARVELERPLEAHGDGEAIAPPGPAGFRFEARPGALLAVSAASS